MFISKETDAELHKIVQEIKHCEDRINDLICRARTYSPGQLGSLFIFQDRAWRLNIDIKRDRFVIATDFVILEPHD